jgi:phospholipase/carboxylesterase
MAPTETELGSAEAVAATGLRHRYHFGHPEAPLLYLVHGRVGNLDLMWAFRRTFPPHWNVLSVEAPIPDVEGALTGFSWWTIGATSGQEGAPNAWQNHLAPFVSKVEAQYQLSPRFRTALGFSQGGAVLSVGAQRSPEVFDGVGLLASFVVKVPIGNSAAAKRPKVFIGHGTDDQVVTISRAEEGRAYLDGLGYETSFATDPVGHKLGSGTVRALSGWLSALG